MSCPGDSTPQKRRRNITPLSAFWPPWPDLRRGLVLYLFSWAVVLLGATNYVVNDVIEPQRIEFALILSRMLGLGAYGDTPWGWVMIALGLFCGFSSFCHFGRDRYGYVALSMFCGWWGFVNCAGWAAYGATSAALGSAVVWFIFAAILTVCAGFPSTKLRQPPGEPPVVEIEG